MFALNKFCIILTPEVKSNKSLNTNHLFMNTYKYLCLLLLLPLSVLAQTKVTGTVVDDQGIPIPSINILVEDTQRGTTTDFDGNYSIDVNDGEVLVYSYLGFKTQKVTFTGQSKIDISLLPDQEQLEEVVLIGYGSSKKKDLTGSVTSISEKDFTKGNIITPENLINGRVAGVSVNTGGAPGSGSAIRIRGGGSLFANNDPLIVVDGLPLSNDTPGGSRSVLSSINPNDIESFSVLKDAAATAIYGNRASAGVIIIKTKQGTKNLSVDINSNIGFYTLPNKVDVFSADEFRSLVTQRFPNQVDRLGNANTDWQDAIYRTGKSIDNNVSIRGQLFDKIPIRLSLGRFQQEGIRKTSEFARTSASIAVNPTFFDDHLRVNLNANFSRESNRFANGVEGAAISFDPTQPIFDSNSPFDGFFEFSSLNQFNQNAIQNPLASLLQRQNNSNMSRFYGNLNLDYRLHFLPEARVIVNLGLDDANGRGTNELSRNSVGGVFEETSSGVNYFGNYLKYENQDRNTLFDAYFKYDNEIVEGIDLRGTVGYSYQKFETTDFTTFDTRVLTPQAPDTFVAPDLVLIGYIGRAFVTIKDKYIFSYSARRDGSSRFAEDNKWGFFQSAAFSWNISDENFLKDSNAISNLKLRASYGETGQQAIGNLVIGTQGINLSQENSFAIIGNNPIQAAFPTASNPNLTWETAKTINLGLDFGFANDRITGSVDVYTRDTEDLFVFAPIPEGTSFTNQIDQNAGTLNTQGVEVGLNAQIFDAKGDKDKFDWNLNYNVTFIDQNVDELANGADINTGSIAGGTGGFIQRLSQGFQPNSFYVYNQVYDSNGAPIEGAYADLNGDNQITPEDRYLYKDPNVNVFMGLQSTMNYKSFDFSFNLRANLGNYVYNNFNASNAQFRRISFVEGVLQNLPTSVQDTNFQVTENVQLSDYYIENASFLRMDNIQFGYTFNPSKNSNSTLRISAGVQNVFVITEYSGLDPEIFNGIDNTIYPRARTFLFGMNYNF
jgi:iron complex outermembrane receptor protein